MKTPRIASDLKDFVLFAKKNGIVRYKCADFEIELAPQAFERRTRRPSNVAADKIESIPEYTDEQLLTWSSSGIPEETL